MGSSSASRPSSTSFNTETATMVWVTAPTCTGSLSWTGTPPSRLRTPTAWDHSSGPTFASMSTARAPSWSSSSLYGSSIAFSSWRKDDGGSSAAAVVDSVAGSGAGVDAGGADVAVGLG